jgi:cytochrome c2
MRLLVLFLILILGVGAAPPKSAKPLLGDATKGVTTFARCKSCHNITSGDTKFGPSLKGLFKKAKLKTGEPVNEETVQHVIDEGVGSMPPYGSILKPQEKADLMAYLKTL